MEDIDEYKRQSLGVGIEEEVEGPPVHDLVAKSWSAILSKGLPKEKKDALVKLHKFPKNLELAKPPKIDSLARTSINQTAVKRDDYPLLIQNVLTAAISAQGALLTELLKKDELWDHKRIFELASDAGNIMAQVQFQMSKSRRSVLTFSWSPAAKAALDEQPFDGNLLGGNLISTMKDAAAADQVLKNATRQASTNNAPKPQQQRNQRKKKGSHGNAQGNSKPLVTKTQATPRETRDPQSATRRRSSSHSRGNRR